MWSTEAGRVAITQRQRALYVYACLEQAATARLQFVFVEVASFIGPGFPEASS